MIPCKECKIEFSYEELYKGICIVCWANKAVELEKKISKKMKEIQELKSSES